VVTLLVGGTASAATYKPTRFDDPPPGKCKFADCSLREAITRANNHDGADKVALSRGHYVIELPEEPGDNNENGDFDVVGEVTIEGEGARKTKIDGGGIARVFTMIGFEKHSVSDLTITGGSDTIGGGIFNGPAPLSLLAVVVKENQAPKGGGLSSVSADLKINRSTFSDNNGSEGGGIRVGAGLNGVPTAVIRNSTISENISALGGGLYVDGTNENGFDLDPGVTVSNSTFALNQASVSGGGIAAIQGASIRLDNTSVGYNRADSDGVGGGSGGGIFQSTGAFFEVGDSVLAANSFGTGSSGQQCSGSFAGARNVVNNVAGCTSFTNANNLIVATTIAESLASNGGPTKTLALPDGSAAIGYLDAPRCPKLDQRGEGRGRNVCDAGSFERKPSDP